MPELPEVHTTAEILNKLATGLKITDAWSDYDSVFHLGKENIKDREYFSKFRKAVVGKTIEGFSRRGKNVIISLSDGHFIVVHMKMTGHLLYGKYKNTDEKWEAETAGPLSDSRNGFIHFVLSLSDGRRIALSDMRKFAKVFYLEKLPENGNLIEKLGPDPFGKNFSEKIFAERLSLRPNGKIKQVLMDQEIISGIGNIYSDEILWESGIHPEEKIKDIPEKRLAEIFKNMREVLEKGIKAGGDSMSDYRNPFGEKGGFQNLHKAYRRTGEKCSKKNCSGIIRRIKVGGRSAHFCPVHQKKIGQ